MLELSAKAPLQSGNVYSRLSECVSRDEDIDVGRKRVVHDHIVGLDEDAFFSSCLYDP